MESKVYHIRQIRQILDDSPIPDGKCSGLWSGYTVKFCVGNRKFEAQTHVGVRGMNIGCDVIVSENGNITIQTR